MEDKFIIVAEYMDSIKADLAKQVLEDFGIQAIIVGQNAGDGRIGVFETVKIQVKQSDAARAAEILESSEVEHNVDEPEGPEDLYDTDGPDEQSEYGEQEEL
jgi:hypothetical protein